MILLLGKSTLIFFIQDIAEEVYPKTRLGLKYFLTSSPVTETRL